jgi:hypothetical protein
LTPALTVTLIEGAAYFDPGVTIMQNTLRTMLFACGIILLLPFLSHAGQPALQIESNDAPNLSQTASDWIEGDNAINFDRIDGYEMDVSYNLPNDNWWTVIYLDQRVERSFAICAGQGILAMRTDGSVQAIIVLPNQCIMLSGYRLDISAPQRHALGTIRVVDWD